MKCEISSFPLHHIDVLVDDVGKGKWRDTSFYGYSERTRRRKSWALLRRLAGASPLPSCVIGDFNDLLSPDDKRGWVDHSNNLFNGFKEVV